MINSKVKVHLALVTALFSVFAMLLTGTFAMEQNRQILGDAFGPYSLHGVQLNDSGTDTDNWFAGPYTEKKISVTNLDTSPEEVLVRVQLTEYLQSFTQVANYAMEDGELLLFATYASGPQQGDFMTWATKQDAEDALTGMGLHLEPMKLDDDDNPGTPDKWYARTTNAETQNGIYGKPLIVSYTHTPKDLYGGVPQNVQDPDEPGYIPYKPHTWDGNSLSAAAPWYGDEEDSSLSTISDYIRWNLGTKVQWQADWNGKDAPVWVLAPDGWCYWLAALPPGTTTENLLETIQLYRMPGGAFHYEIDTKLEAITADELNDPLVWSEADTDLRAALEKAGMATDQHSQLQTLADEVRAMADTELEYTPSSWAALQRELEKAETLLARVFADYDSLYQQWEDLKTVKDDTLEKRADMTQLLDVIAQADALTEASYTPGSWAIMKSVRDSAMTATASPETTQAMADDAATRLQTAIQNLVLR